MTDDKDTFSFERRLIAKHGELVTVNHGNDESTATVAHLRYTNDGEELIELDYDEVARNYGSKELLRKNLFKDRDRNLLNQDSGLGATPDWFEHITAAIDWDRNSFVYELDHLNLDLFYCREITGRIGHEYIFSITRDAQKRFHTQTVALLYIDGDTDHGLEDGIEAGIYHWFNDTQELETRLHFYRDAADIALPDYVKAGLEEMLTGVCLKHGYIKEIVELQVEAHEDFVRVAVPDKNFTLVFDITEDGLSHDVPVWAKLLLREDGCPVQLSEVHQ